MNKFLILDSSACEVVERFNANISYSGLLYAVTQEVSRFLLQ